MKHQNKHLKKQFLDGLTLFFQPLGNFKNFINGWVEGCLESQKVQEVVPSLKFLIKNYYKQKIRLASARLLISFLNMTVKLRRSRPSYLFQHYFFIEPRELMLTFFLDETLQTNTFINLNILKIAKGVWHGF